MSIPRKIRCKVSAITGHAGGVYTVDLKPGTPVPSFQPGQFLHLTVDDYDPSGFWPESRVFSIVSSPRDRSLIRICYSVKGRYTTRMEQALQIGGAVWIKLPYGEFFIDDTCDAVLIAGGTGISAFTAFMEALPPRETRKVRLVYGARMPDLWLFRDLIERQIAACPSFSAIFFSESSVSALPRTPESPKGAKAADIGSRISILPGRISLDPVLRPLTSAPHSLAVAIFYLSGPPTMLKVLGTDLQTRGIAAERIRTDAWD